MNEEKPRLPREEARKKVAEMLKDPKHQAEKGSARDLETVDDDLPEQARREDG